MHHCTYCNCKINSRPQVKNPKACLHPKCQKERQRDNERLWHEKQRGKFNAEYHKKQRKLRKSAISGMLEKIVKALNNGFLLIGQRFDKDSFKDLFRQFLMGLGLRRANKLCPGIST